MALSCVVFVAYFRFQYRILLKIYFIFSELIHFLRLVAADGVVLASGEDHHVSTRAVVHNRGARLQHDDVLQPSRTTRTHYPHRQNYHWRSKKQNQWLNTLYLIQLKHFSIRLVIRYSEPIAQVGGQNGIRKIATAVDRDILERARRLSSPSYLMKSNTRGLESALPLLLKARLAYDTRPNSSWHPTGTWLLSVEGKSNIFKFPPFLLLKDQST